METDHWLRRHAESVKQLGSRGGVFPQVVNYYQLDYPHVCGQELLGKKVDPSQVLSSVQVDRWLMVTMVNLQSRGYVQIGG